MPTIRGVARRGGSVMRSARRAGLRQQGAWRLARALPVDAMVHLGCGPIRLDGWVNVDIDRSVKPDIRLDLRLGFPAPPESISFLYSEHVLEHFTLNDGCQLLADCRRSLRSGGVFRAAMPDLRVVIDAYLGDWRQQSWLAEFDDIDSPAHMLNFGLREWGHTYLYDLPEITFRLKQAGFRDVELRSMCQSPYPQLKGLERRPDSLLIVEAVA